MKQKIKFMRQPSSGDLKTKNAIFSISLREFPKPYELYNAVELARNTFGKCDISLCDSLQRFNYLWQKNMSIELAHQLANQAGEEWVKELTRHTILSPTIIRWDYWLEHAKFEEKMNEIKLLYDEDSLFREAVISSVQTYLKRFENKENMFTYSAAIQASIEFVKEEVAVLLLQADHGYHFEVFLEKRNPALQYFYEKKLWHSYPDHLQPAFVKITL